MRRHSVLVACCLAASAVVLSAPAATADPLPPTSAPQAAAARVVSTTMETDRRVTLSIYSPSMAREVDVEVLLPANRSAPRPTLYMLDGVSAGEESEYTESTWTQKTDAESFFADKAANVVLPIGGRGSYYADWQQTDPVLGLYKWETFLTAELPPIIDAQFDGNGTNAIMGLSMGAQGAMNLITKHPDLYTGVAAFSGCYDNRTDEARNAVRATVGSTGGDATNMWGPNADPAWVDNDPSEHITALQGKEIYLAVGNGLPGPNELANPTRDSLMKAALGAPLEAASRICTESFIDDLRAAGIPSTDALRPYGSHTWPAWQEDLHASWPVVSRALGL